MVLIYIVLFTSLCLAQEMQIKYTTVFSVDAKIIGPIETTFDRIVAPGYAKVIMKIDAIIMIKEECSSCGCTPCDCDWGNIKGNLSIYCGGVFMCRTDVVLK